MIPQGNQVFEELTVYENLEIASFILKDKSTIKKRFEKIYEEFPQLAKRRKQLAGKLSGGEKQMLALGMVLMQRPKLLLMDEPSLGLSPSFIKQSFDLIRNLREKYHISVLIIEQKVKEVLQIADYVYLLRLGKVALKGDAKKLLNKGEYKKIFLQ